MSNILLVEPDYRAKFPPLGLMKISAYHKARGDTVTFVRGKVPEFRDIPWHRVYVSSLFTYELPRTIETIKYYSSAVANPHDIFVGGIAATLFPQYIRARVECTVVEGLLDKPDMLGAGTPPIANIVPDYSILGAVNWQYKPDNAYFCRATKGCIRKCKFCAVPKLEPEFDYCDSLSKQIREAAARYGERQNLVLLDNNILAASRLKEIIAEIRNAGFGIGDKLNGKERTVDFNQGIDARLISEKVAQLLATIPLSPVRLAFDYDEMETPYRQAIERLAHVGFTKFTNYVMFNFDDTPLSFYYRLRTNIELSEKLGVSITGFPMRYIPINSVKRQYISKAWNWRYLRGIQCILLATHGLVSPNPDFFDAAFGSSFEEFLEIITMPDRYIIHRNRYKDNEAAEWRGLYRKLSKAEREEFLRVLAKLHWSNNRKTEMLQHKKFRDLLEHYYPGGKVPKT